jgi:modulator of FtsH protease
VIETWESFGVVVGAASGALIGLLFVAISVNGSRIVDHPALRDVASRTLVLFAIPLVAAILVVTPGQPDWVLGTELIVLGLVAGAALILVGRGHLDTDASTESRLARTLDRRSPTLTTSLLTEIAGVTLIVGGGGLYWLLPAVILALIGGALNAWLLLVGFSGNEVTSA